MTERSVTHATFCLERIFDAPPERAFAAFADLEAKTQWFAGPPEWRRDQQEFDFRVGGRERVASTPPGEPSHIFDCTYQDIVPNERIVYTYIMYLGETNTSVSITTIEFHRAGAGTRLVFTEQGAFLDGADAARQREQGSQHLMDAVAGWVMAQTAHA